MRASALLSALLLIASACGDDAAEPDNPQSGADAAAEGRGEPAAACRPSQARCASFGAERPPRTSEHAAAYDPERGELVVFGGTDTIPEGCALGGSVRFLDATWIYSDRCDAWLRAPGAGPSARGRHMAAWGAGSVWIFGGRYRDEASTGAYELFDDLFRFEVETRTWHAVEVTGERPAARTNGALVWDGPRERLWLFGGNASTSGASYGPLDDVWSFDPAAGRWERAEVQAGGPAPRLFHGALYDPKRDALVIFGGADASAFAPAAGYFADLWSLSLEDLRWTRLDPGGDRGPEGRFWGALVYETGRDAYLLFGGHDDQQLGNRNDTWRFDLDEGRFVLLGGGDALRSQARGVCDFPPDFTAVDLAAPERRSAHSVVWSEPCGHALVFGGKTDCGAIDDVWSFDGNRWQERMKATEGESCLRWREQPEQCGDLCF